MINLIKTSAELKANFSSLETDYKLVSLKSFIDDAEKDILVPWIGQGMYDSVLAAYDPGTIAGKKAALLPYLQKAVTHLALFLSADSGSFRISDSGFYVVNTATNRPVSDKKMAEFKKGRRESGYRALEQAIEYLEANVDDAEFAVYKASDQHAQHRAYFINSSVDFTRYYKKMANSAYLFNQVQDALDYAERTYIRPVLGNDYFNELKTDILANTLDAPQKKLIPYIARALVNYTMAKAIPGLPIEFDGTGLVISSMPAYGNSENVVSKSAAPADRLNDLVAGALENAQVELSNLEDYLIDNASALPGYTPPDDSTEDFNINDPNAPTYFV